MRPLYRQTPATTGTRLIWCLGWHIRAALAFDHACTWPPVLSSAPAGDLRSKHHSMYSWMCCGAQDTISTAETMMREHLDLLFEQHLSRLVACCVYGTTRKHNVVVSIKVRSDLPIYMCADAV